MSRVENLNKPAIHEFIASEHFERNLPSQHAHLPPSRTEKFWLIQGILVEASLLGCAKVADKICSPDMDRNLKDKVVGSIYIQEITTRSSFSMIKEHLKGNIHLSGKELLGLTFGNVIPAIAETLYNIFALIGNFFKALWNLPGALLGYRDKTRDIKIAGVSLLSNFNQIFRNIFRAIPVGGHILANLYDAAQIYIIRETHFESLFHKYRDYDREY